MLGGGLVDGGELGDGGMVEWHGMGWGRRDLQGRRRRVHAEQKRRKGDSLGTVEGWVCARYQDVTVATLISCFVW